MALAAGAVALLTSPGLAHKPVTSPFTYNDDVYPILRDRCGQCHVNGGVAPMSLLTHEDTVPWGESIRVELLARHMPPWGVDAAASRFRNAESLTAREMNVLLTWATGGTPYGTPDKAPPPVTRSVGWRLGPPDLQLPFPSEITLPSNAQEETVEVVIPAGTAERRAIRAVDLLPGTPAIVRSAVVSVRSAAPSTAGSGGTESVLAMWLPGDEPVAADGGMSFELPAGAELVVRVHYKKTWQFERKEMRDRSTLGLYFAREPSAPLRAVTIASGRDKSFVSTIVEDVRVAAIYPGDGLSNARVVVTAIGTDGARRELIAFHPRAGWARRYWFREPIALARGTKIETRITADNAAASLPLVAPPVTGPRPDVSDSRLTLNVVTRK